MVIFLSYAKDYGSHAPPFGSPFMLMLVEFAQESELWRQVMSISHRYAPRLFRPFMVWILQEIMAFAMPTKRVRPMYKSTDFDAV